MPTRRGRRLTRAAALFAALAPGCLWPQTRVPAPIPYPVEGARSVTVLRTALADRPAGDAYLGDGVWSHATRPLPHELAALLALNGLRVGVLTGVPNAEFAALCDPETLTAPTDRTFPPGRSRVVPVAGPLPRAAVALTAEIAADPRRKSFDEAECGLSITATPLEGGRVKLQCEPQLQYGEPRAFLQPADDATLTQRERKPREPLPHLAFSVTLGPGESLIVGPTADPAGTLGEAFFVDANPSRARQRLLIVRVNR